MTSCFTTFPEMHSVAISGNYLEASGSQELQTRNTVLELNHINTKGIIC